MVNEVPADGKLVDVLLPGFIVADSQVQFGEPCLIDTRLPWYVGQGWVWEYLDDPEKVHPGLTREHIIALAAFHAGYRWSQRRARRQRMVLATRRLWELIAARGKKAHEKTVSA